jgi:hypothetical protein
MTIKQQTEIITVEGGPTITVRRFAWRPLLDFLAALGAFVAKRKDGVSAASLLADFGAVLAESEDLVAKLVLGCTNLTLDQFGQLDLMAAAEVIRTAVALNTDAELKKSCAGIGEALGFAKIRPSAGGDSTPISSMPATPPPTSTPAPSSTSSSSANPPTS